MKKIIISIAFIFIILTTSTAQKEANIWYFGTKSGINFNTEPPTLLTDGQTDQLEGVATASDSLGNLLFYTDGMSVWSKNHQMMDNGQGLLGSFTASQSALIIPNPTYKNLYYLFTVGSYGANIGLNYSIIDLSYNNGLGKIIQKNISLLSRTTEKLAGIKHCNQKDFWIVTSKWQTNQLYSYLVTKEGVCQQAVISETGQIQNDTQGYMKFSPDGSKLALTFISDFGNTNSCELFNFDTSNGKIKFFLQIPIKGLYGLTFSQDGTKLYVNNGWDQGFSACAKIFQFDLNNPDIFSSKYEIYTNSNGNGCYSRGLGAMQLAPNGKIYIASWPINYLHIIHKPNELGSNIDFEEKGFELLERGDLGLPNFIESYFASNQNSPSCAIEIETPRIIKDCNMLIIDKYNTTPFQWLKNGVPIPNANGLTLNVIEEGNYAVRVGILCATKTSNEIFASLIDVEKPQISRDCDILDSHKQKDVQWLKNGFLIPNETNPTLEVKEVGNYSAQINNECGIFVSEAIYINPINENKLFIPNVFTPNGDNRNEYFVLDDSLIGSKLSVYNRWGAIVYHSDNYQNDWNGSDLPNGVYYYLLENQCFSKSKKGYVEILK